MTLSAETEVSARTAYRKPKTDKPVRTKLWFSIMVVLMALLVGVFWGFNQFRNHMIAQFFANMKMPPATVSVADVKSEVLPNLLTGIGDVVAVHQVNVTSEVSGRVVKIMFEPGTHVKKGQPLVQLFDEPEQGDLASFQAQAVGAKLSLDRAKALALRQFGPQATVDDQQATYDQAMAGISKTKAIISQKLILAPFDGELGLRHIEVGQFLNAGTQIVTLTDLSVIWVNFTVTEKNSAQLKLGQTVNISVDSYPGRVFTGKITTVEPQVSTDTRNIEVQATFENPDHALKPGMFATATIVLPSEAPVMTVPETAADYSLYGDSVFLIKKSQGADGKPALTAERTFVKTGERIDGRVVIASKDIKPGDQVVAVGQIKLQSGVPVAISSDPPPKIPAESSPY
ncbi:MAG: efflux RND transporter periplasmic adaptor subunit [Methylovirgula sp.]|uniref:efflux RND transporter periplasmic adaptor subunit n=1 Tax=Methylovirgula sp. TaxID=1978224 RepID=UPI003075FB7B